MNVIGQKTMGIALTTFRYPFLSGIFLPFKVVGRAGIKIGKGAKIVLKSRLTLGNAGADLPVVSRLPVNIYFGKQCSVTVGASVSVGQGVNIIVKNGAAFSVGDRTYFTSDSHIEVVNEIAIGSDCAISWGVTIIDDDHHRLIVNGIPKEDKKHSVHIGNRVWIGCNVTVLKGTVIGNNCVVAAGSVVKGVFADNTLIAGNPAKAIKQTIDWK